MRPERPRLKEVETRKASSDSPGPSVSGNLSPTSRAALRAGASSVTSEAMVRARAPAQRQESLLKI